MTTGLDVTVPRTTPVARLLGHAVALLVLLTAVAFVVDPTVSFSADEGAVIAQVDAIRSGSWSMPLPVPEIDETGRWFPLEKPALTDAGAAPYAKHPLYPLLLVPFASVGGTPGMVGASILGTVLAALGTALVAARVDRRAAVPALWVAGVASPLFFDSLLVMAHTLAAAACAWAVLCVLRALDRERPAWDLVAAGALLGVAALLRSEALFLGPALAVGVLLVGPAVSLRRRLTVGAVTSAATVGAYVIDGWFSQLVLGGSGTNPYVPGSTGGGLAGRVEGFANTWLRPSAESIGLGAAMLLGAVVVFVLLGLATSRPRPDHERVRVLAVLGPLLVLGAGATAGSDVVPGLLVAFPLLAWLLGWTASLSTEPAPRLLLVSFGAFAAAVIATQYAAGGVAEWGGRYFAVGLPLVVPMVVLSLVRARDRLDPSTGAMVVGSAVLTSLVLAVVAVASLRAAHDRVDAVVTGIDEVVRSKSTDGPPVVVATSPLIPRLSWAHLDDARWLLVPGDELSDLLDAADRVGVDQILVVTSGGLDRQVDDTAPFDVVDVAGVWGPWTVTTLCQGCR